MQKPKYLVYTAGIVLSLPPKCRFPHSSPILYIPHSVSSSNPTQQDTTLFFHKKRLEKC